MEFRHYLHLMGFEANVSVLLFCVLDSSGAFQPARAALFLLPPSPQTHNARCGLLSISNSFNKKYLICKHTVKVGFRCVATCVAFY